MLKCSFVAFAVATVLSSSPSALAQSAPQPFQIASAGFAEAAPMGLASSSSAASGDPSAVMAAPQPSAPQVRTEIHIRPFSRVAFGTKMGTLGWGGQIATPILRRVNLRGGVNVFNMGYGLTSDGTDYYASAHLKAGTIQGDIYPFRNSSFFVSPGVLIFKNQITATLNVPGGNTFSVGDDDYTSDPNDPVHGNGVIHFGRTYMPMFTLGFGNMIPRRENRHLSFPVELGAAYTGQNSMSINMQGSACNNQGCGNSTEADFQQGVQNQQAKINEQFKKYQIYPVLNFGVTYRF